MARLPKYSIRLDPIKPWEACSTAHGTDDDEYEYEGQGFGGQTPIRGSGHEPIEIKGCRPFSQIWGQTPIFRGGVAIGLSDVGSFLEEQKANSTARETDLEDDDEYKYEGQVLEEQTPIRGGGLARSC